MRLSHKQISLGIVSSVVMFAGACATEPPPRPVALDPSHPAAAESAPASITSLAQAATPPAEVASPEAGQPAKPGPTVYTCPMHPEVTSDKPGRCPKCGMDLVPKEKGK
jgi:hypothetical protein